MVALDKEVTSFITRPERMAYLGKVGRFYLWTLQELVLHSLYNYFLWLWFLFCALVSYG